MTYEHTLFLIVACIEAFKILAPVAFILLLTYKINTL